MENKEWWNVNYQSIIVRDISADVYGYYDYREITRVISDEQSNYKQMKKIDL